MLQKWIICNSLVNDEIDQTSFNKKENSTPICKHLIFCTLHKKRKNTIFWIRSKIYSN